MKHSMNQIFWSLKSSFFVFLSVYFLIIPTVLCASKWQEELEQHFDIVETFDDLDNWYGTEYKPPNIGDIFADGYPDDFPKIDGEPSRWCYYSKWDAHPSTGEKYWISNFGTYFSTDEKAAVIDLSNINGPSRLGTYFGNGKLSSGYKDVYVFYMAKISRKHFPTRCEKNGQTSECLGGGPLGIYKEGENYSYFAGCKFNTIGTGWNTCQKWEGSVPDHDHRYGDSSIIPQIRVNNYGPIPRLDNKPEQIQNLVLVGHIKGAPQTETKLVYDENEVNIDEIGKSIITWTGKGCALITDEWMGVEFHYILEEPAGSGNGKMEVWIYNKEGQFRRAFYIEGINYLPASGQGHRFNRFFLGGNNSNSYLWGPTMEAPYYVDDLIISGSRIGPKYFELLGFDNAGTLPQPQNLRIIETLETSPNVQKP